MNRKDNSNLRQHAYMPLESFTTFYTNVEINLLGILTGVISENN